MTVEVEYTVAMPVRDAYVEAIVIQHNAREFDTLVANIQAVTTQMN